MIKEKYHYIFYEILVTINFDNYNSIKGRKSDSVNL